MHTNRATTDLINAAITTTATIWIIAKCALWNVGGQSHMIKNLKRTQMSENVFLEIKDTYCADFMDP